MNRMIVKCSDDGKLMEASLFRGRRKIGFASCLFNEADNSVQIRSLFVTQQKNRSSFLNQLLQETEEFAQKKSALSIAAFPGPEPFCSEPWIPLEEEIAFYVANDYEQATTALLNSPKLIKRMDTV